MFLTLCDMINDTFTLYIFSQIFDKRENMYITNIPTFTVSKAIDRYYDKEHLYR